MMRVLVAFSLTNGKTQPYKSTSPPVKMPTGPCARLPRDLGSALSEPARLSLGLKHRSTSWNGSSDPRGHTARLSTAQRLLLPPAAATPTVAASTPLGYGGQVPGRVRSNFVGNRVCFHFCIRKLLLSPLTPPAGNITSPNLVHHTNIERLFDVA